MTKTTKIILLAAIAVIILLSVTFCSILGGLINKDPADLDTLPGVLPPDHPPMETDPNQEKVDDATVAPSVSGGTATIAIVDTARVDLSDKTIAFSYSNTQSNQNAVVRLSVQDVLLGESATINPGNKITKMTLNDDAVARLQAGTYNGDLIIGFYHPETGEKSMVDMRFKISVIVQD